MKKRNKNYIAIGAAILLIAIALHIFRDGISKGRGTLNEK